MSSDTVIEQTVEGMGYELVDVEWAGGGVLRVYIDKPAAGPAPGSVAASVAAGAAAGSVQSSISVDDCAVVSEQLSRVFAVENVNYERLEISSPGLDRPLKKLSDFARFAGHEAFVKLRMSPTGQARGRRQFQGVLQGPLDEPATRIGLVLEGKEGVPELLEFAFDEVEKARLVPRIEFRGKAGNVGSKKR